MSHSRFDYSGGDFGAPSSKLLSKSWRLQHNMLGRMSRVTTNTLGRDTLLGQDSISASEMLHGLGVYGGYGYGTYSNIAEVRKLFGGSAKIVSISPVVESAASVQCLDIEPGNAAPSSAPAFMNLPNHDGAEKPVFYMSAGDTHLVIAALTAAGYARSSYYLWSAHWIGLHICSPSTCGYPTADATQYASGDSYDSDIWESYVFGAPNPFPTLSLTSPITRDPVNTVPAVHTAQTRLNVWEIPPVSAPDGAFGPVTEARVRTFQVRQGIAVDGVVGPVTWAHLNVNPAGPKKPVPASAVPKTVVTTSYSITVDRSIPGYKGVYGTKIWYQGTGSGAAPVVVYDHESTGSVIVVPVHRPGKYTVAVGAEGWANNTLTVEVPAA